MPRDAANAAEMTPEGACRELTLAGVLWRQDGEYYLHDGTYCGDAESAVRFGAVSLRAWHAAYSQRWDTTLCRSDGRKLFFVKARRRWRKNVHDVLGPYHRNRTAAMVMCCAQCLQHDRLAGIQVLKRCKTGRSTNR